MPAGLYLVNCTKGEEKRSAVAFYDTILLDGGNDNQQPDAFQYTSFGSFTSWEGTQQGMLGLNVLRSMAGQGNVY